jgi:uncharacterized coiled-coil protein SlyX
MLIDTDEFGALADMLSAQKIKALEERIAAQERRIAAQDERIATLEGELDSSKKDAEYWRQSCERAETMKAASEMENLYLKNYFMLSLERIRAFVERLKSIDHWAFLRTFMQWALPEELQAKELPLIDKVMPMPQPQKPSVTVTAEGDVNVEGNYNDVHDNDKVTF